MIHTDKLTPDILPLYDYYIYSNLMRSLQRRSMGKVGFLDDNNGTMLSWGISVFVGGEFSEANGEKVLAALDNSDSPRWFYFPDDRWTSFVKNARPDKLKDKWLNLYQSDGENAVTKDDSQCIVPVTREFIKMNLPGTEAVTDEMYSYADAEDFFQNGFGVALVIDGAVSGYCLSEYTVDNSHGINIWVDEKYRRSGYAGKMVGRFLNHCRDRNQTAYWACNADNIPSNRLAVSCGFVLKSTMHYFEI